MSDLPIARLRDICIGRCRRHKYPRRVMGFIIGHSSNVDSNIKGNARVGDLVVSKCNHKGIIVTGAPTVFINNKKAARVTDLFVGVYKGIIVKGSENVRS